MLCSNQLSYVAKGEIGYLKRRAADKFLYDISRLRALDVEAEMHDVTVLHDIVLALQAQFSGLFRAMLAVTGDEIVITDHLGTDKALLEIGVYDTCSLRRFSTNGDGPGPNFLGAGRNILL